MRQTLCPKKEKNIFQRESDATKARDNAADQVNGDLKHVFPISDAERADILSAADGIAGIPLGTAVPLKI